MSNEPAQPPVPPGPPAAPPPAQPGAGTQPAPAAAPAQSQPLWGLFQGWFGGGKPQTVAVTNVDAAKKALLDNAAKYAGDNTHPTDDAHKALAAFLTAAAKNDAFMAEAVKSENKWINVTPSKEGNDAIELLDISTLARAAKKFASGDKDATKEKDASTKGLFDATTNLAAQNFKYPDGHPGPKGEPSFQISLKDSDPKEYVKFEGGDATKTTSFLGQALPFIAGLIPLFVGGWDNPLMWILGLGIGLVGSFTGAGQWLANWIPGLGAPAAGAGDAVQLEQIGRYIEPGGVAVQTKAGAAPGAPTPPGAAASITATVVTVEGNANKEIPNQKLLISQGFHLNDDGTVMGLTLSNGQDKSEYKVVRGDGKPLQIDPEVLGAVKTNNTTQEEAIAQELKKSLDDTTKKWYIIQTKDASGSPLKLPALKNSNNADIPVDKLLTDYVVKADGSYNVDSGTNPNWGLPTNGALRQPGAPLRLG